MPYTIVNDCIMRKRKYSHTSNEKYKEDNLTEIIEEWNSKRKKKQVMSDVPKAEIHNLVGTTQIICNCIPLSLMRISKMIPNNTYDRQKFAAITVRLNSPFCTILLFTSGKMVLTGCRTFIECMLASHYVLQFLRTGMVGVKFSLSEVKIQNIVGNVDLNLQSDQKMLLRDMMETYSVYCTYQKNTFPGLIFRPNNSPVVLLVFESGKIVITGGRSYHDVTNGWKQLWPIVQKFIGRPGNVKV